MKPKIFKKKMELNKRTIANLNNPEMKDIYAGIYETHITACNCNTIRTCWTDATCCGACETDFKCPITTDMPLCETLLEC